MKKLVIALLITGFFNCVCYAEDEPQKTLGGVIQDAKKAIGPAGEETKSLKLFLGASIQKYSSNVSSIQNSEKEFESAYYNEKISESDKIDLLIKHLDEKIDSLDKIIEDFNFVNVKVSSKVGTLNKVIGEVGEQSVIVEKAKTAASETDGITSQIEKLQLEWRDIKSKSPEPGTDKYMAWFEKSMETKRDFIKSVGQLKRAIRQEVIYSWLSEKMKMGKEDVVRWQQYTATLTLIFQELALELQTEKEIATDIKAAAEAGKVFGEIEDITSFAGQMGDMISKITDSPMPPIPTIGGEGPDDTKIKELLEKFKYDIDTFKPQDFKKNLREQMKQTPDKTNNNESSNSSKTKK